MSNLDQKATRNLVHKKYAEQGCFFSDADRKREGEFGAEQSLDILSAAEQVKEEYCISSKGIVQLVW